MKRICIICIAALFLLMGCKGNTDKKTMNDSDSAASDKTEISDLKSEDNFETPALDIKNESKSTTSDKAADEKEENSFQNKITPDDYVQHESESSKTNSAKEEKNETITETNADSSEITTVDEEKAVEFPFIPLE